MKKKAGKKKAGKRPAAKTAAKPRAQASVATPAYPPVFYRLHALLHTMRLIAEHEEGLCIAMTEVKNTGEVSAALSRELRSLLGEMPLAELQRDLLTLREALAAPPTRSATKRPGSQPAKQRKRT